MIPRLLLLFFLSCYAAFAGGEDRPLPAAGAVWVLGLDGPVGPATSDYLVRGIEKASTNAASLIVIEMNTPGGLDGAMRDIIEAILASRVPIATYVTPRGARAASAGTYILYASHIAAMAPATNLGAATPVSIGAPSAPQGLDAPPEQDAPDKADSQTPSGESAMERKMINDAAAYIRGLASLRERNSEWAEQAVRDAASLSAEEALAANVIDYVAADLPNLLEQLDGKTLLVQERDLVLELENAEVFNAQPDWRTELLATITNPSLVLILGMIGFYGIILEFYNPGALVPGTVGVICLLLAGYALQLLPVNYAGLALLLVGIGLMIAEAVSRSFGILGAGGLVAFVMGGIILFDTDIDAFRVGWPVLLAIGLLSVAFILATITIALRMRDKAVATGVQLLIGQQGIALEDFAESGQVQVGGEIWEASASSPLSKGDPVRVTAVAGLTLSVDKE